MDIVALDISSCFIGAAVIRDGDPIWANSVHLHSKDLYGRIDEAYTWITELAQNHRRTLLAIEAPAYRSHEHVAIQRVTGAVLAAWLGVNSTGVVEIAPTTAKKALTGSGKADKELMLRYGREYACARHADEHAVDALAVGIAAWGKEHRRLLIEAQS